MKLLFIFIFVLSCHLAFGAGWKCVKYKVELQLNDNSIIKGFIIEVNNIKFEFADQDFDSFIKDKKLFNYDLEVFKEIYSLEYPQIEGLNKNNYKFTATPKDKIVNIKRERIKKAKLLEILPCNPCLLENKEDCFGWVGHQVVIKELELSEIRLLNTAPLNFLQLQNPIFEYGAIYCFQYSNITSIEELTSYFEKLKLIIDDIADINDKIKKFNSEYEIIKRDLKNKNIIVFLVFYAP